MHKKISLILAVMLLAAALPMAVLATEVGTSPAPATDAPVSEEPNTPPPVETPKVTDTPNDTDAPVTTNPTATPAPSGLPVITKNPTDETVEAGGRAPFTARAKNDKGRTWYFISPDGQETLTVKEAKDKFKGITVTGEHDEKLVIKKVTAEMDGWRVLCNFYNSKGNVDSAMATIHIKTKATAAPGSEEGLPVITKNPTDETVEAGGQAPFTARADNDKGRTWYFVSPDGQEILTVQEAKDKFKGITVTGEHDERLVIKKVTAEMNGWRVLCNFYNSKGDVDSAMATIHIKTKATATPAPEGLPVITKDPTKETVTEGGSCSFVARADNADAYDWYFTKGSKTYTVTEALSKFKGLKVSGEETEKLKLRKIPLELDGWKVYCVFTNEKGEIWSKTALITVKEAEETPKATATATPTIQPTDVPATDVPTSPATSDNPVNPTTSDSPIAPVISPENSVEPTDAPTQAPTDTPEPVVPSVEPDPPSTEPDDPEDGGTNTVLVAALIGVGVLLIAGGAGTAVILSKRNNGIMDMDEDE